MGCERCEGRGRTKLADLSHHLARRNGRTTATRCVWMHVNRPGRVVVDAPILGELKPRLPTPVGQLLQTSPRFRTLPWTDQLSMAPLMLAAIDVGAERERYDNMSAEELFRICGVTKRLHDEFLKPLLLVGLFAPPEEVSAAAMLETFYFYALAHQNDFDVRWCRSTVADAFFAPMVRDIEADGGRVLARKFVRDVKAVGNQVNTVVAQDEEGNRVEYQADAVVFAVGISGMKKILQTSRTLGSRSEFNGVMNLKSIDCVATRLWFDRIVPTKTPSNVISGFYDDIGGTFFHLNDIQDEFKNADGSVIAADFYHANALLPMTDEQIVAEVKSNLAACIPGYADANVVDSAVLRFPQAVTHFSPGSERYRMTQTTSFDNVFVAGDWVKELDHGSNGLSQERAYVTGLSAANLAMSKLGLSKKAGILQVEPDEAHIAAAKQLNRSLHYILDATGIPQLFL